MGETSSLPSLDAIRDYAVAMKERASKQVPLTTEELDSLEESLVQLEHTSFDKVKLKKFWLQVAHIPHDKDWDITIKNAQQLKQLLGMDGDLKKHPWLDRILTEGHWQEAPSQAKPYVVLVTGLNGIRKSSAMYQPWFSTVLSDAIGKETSVDLPTGHTSFFRQLDHMIATMCNQEFKKLYQSIRGLVKDEGISADVTQAYANLKASIFSRFRTVSELLGIVLLRLAQDNKKNCLLETSGRNQAMFAYVDQIFPETMNYQKLALHFTVNDLKAAQSSVDLRMKSEISAGASAQTAQQIVSVNEGGPYGSDVLPAVQSESDAVWDLVEKGEIASKWQKASIQIEARQSQPWVARAVFPDGSLGQEYQYERRGQKRKMDDQGATA